MRHMWIASVLCAVSAPPPVWAQATGAARPNVVLIITDDLGYGDLGIHGAPDIRTPNVDALARAGVRFTDFYANAPLCTPTRAALISGRYQQRVRLEEALSSATTPSAEVGLPASGGSLPELLKQSGYTTGLIGKWHLGYKPEYSPQAHGFDYFFGNKSGYVDYYQHTGGDGRPDLFENGNPVTASGYMTDLITERSVTFVQRNAKRPFFLEVAYGAPHWPYQPPDKPSKAVRNAAHLTALDGETSTRADYVTMVERADRGIGRILRTLELEGLARNTLVIFTNDNGGEWLSRNAPFFHRKWTLWEGGIRVPAIMRWPGHIPAGRVSSQVGITMDLTASILAAAGATVPAAARHEGHNLLPLVSGRARPLERTLFWRTSAGGYRQRAVRSGDWKLLLDAGSGVMLFNVRSDLGERHDVAARHTSVVRRLAAQLAAWEKDVDEEAKRMPPPR